MSLLKRIEEGVRWALASGRAKSESDLCRKAGLSKSYVTVLRTRWAEKGAALDPRSRSFLRLARAMGVSPIWLLDGEGPMVEAGTSDPLTVACATSWWEPDPVPSPEMAAQIQREAREKYARAPEKLSDVYWADHMRSRLRELRLLAKVAGEVPSKIPGAPSLSSPTRLKAPPPTGITLKKGGRPRKDKGK